MGVSISKVAKSLLEKDIAIRQVPLKFYGAKEFIKYEPVYKSAGLQRFCTEEMKTARAMNKIAIRQAKSPVVRSYSEASVQDLKRLTSTTIEDSYSRVEWTNPKDGKVYNILKQGETKDGKISVRILNENGGFIKEAELTPKTIGIPDNFTDKLEDYGLSHGELVATFARRTNPFAKYVPFNFSKDMLRQQRELDEVFDYLNKGGKLDYLSCSYGANVYVKRKMNPELSKMASPMYDQLSEKGTRVLCSANNSQVPQLAKEMSNDILVLNQKVEGVGSLNPKTAKISDFSLSRNSSLTQHYEVGEYTPKITPHGVNITGTTGTDIGFYSKKLEAFAANPFINKAPERVKHLLDTINSRILDIQKSIADLFKSKKPFSELMKEKTLLEQQQMLYSQRRRKVLGYTCNLSIVDGKLQVPLTPINGTSFAAPVRTAKLALNDMLDGII